MTIKKVTILNGGEDVEKLYQHISEKNVIAIGIPENILAIS